MKLRLKSDSLNTPAKTQTLFADKALTASSATRLFLVGLGSTDAIEVSGFHERPFQCSMTGAEVSPCPLAPMAQMSLAVTTLALNSTFLPVFSFAQCEPVRCQVPIPSCTPPKAQ